MCTWHLSMEEAVLILCDRVLFGGGSGYISSNKNNNGLQLVNNGFGKKLYQEHSDISYYPSHKIKGRRLYGLPLGSIKIPLNLFNDFRHFFHNRPRKNCLIQAR